MRRRAAGNLRNRSALRERVGGDAARWAHVGATSQDVMDSAAMLVARNAPGLVDDELEGVAAACARLADEHRGTVMPARTLLQQAVPTTFGLKAAGWLVDVLDARMRLGRLTLPVQLGGGRNARRSPKRVEIARPSPMSSIRGARAALACASRANAELAGALGAVASASAKIGPTSCSRATEVGEVEEAEAASRRPCLEAQSRRAVLRGPARGVHAQVPILTDGEYEL